MRSHREDGSRRDTQFLCVGGGSENEFSIWDQLTIMGDCSRKELVRSGAGWTFDARCELFGSVMESKGTMSGDFRDRFRVDLTVVNDGRRQAGSIRGEHKGACPSPFKPGDLISDGRVLMNVLNGDACGRALPQHRKALCRLTEWPVPAIRAADIPSEKR